MENVAAATLQPVAREHDSTRSRHAVGIQVLRGVAAAAVVVHHLLEESAPLFAHPLPDTVVRLGASGVDVFFVISGFIMLHTSWNKFARPEAPALFLRHRVLRIFPLFWCCAAVVLLARTSGVAYRSLHADALTVGAALVLLPMGAPVLGVAWTLVYEMYFYLTFAIGLLLPRASGLGVIVLSLLVLAGVGTLLPASELARFLANPIMLEFLYGIAIALLYRKRGVPRRPVLGCCVALLLLALASMLGAEGHTSGIDGRVRFLVWGVPAAMLVHSSLALVDTRSLLLRACKKLGDASYSLYLTHTFVMLAYARAIKSQLISTRIPVSLAILTAFGASVLVGVIVYRLVEQPLTRLARRLMGAEDACTATT